MLSIGSIHQFGKIFLDISEVVVVVVAAVILYDVITLFRLDLNLFPSTFSHMYLQYTCHVRLKIPECKQKLCIRVCTSDKTL